MSRTGQVERATKETKVLVEIELDGSGLTDVVTGIGFFDHMLSSFGKHGLFDLRVMGLLRRLPISAIPIASTEARRRLITSW